MARRSFFESSNPFMRETVYQSTSHEILDGSASQRMTVRGAVTKSFILAIIMLFTALIGFSMPTPLMVWGGGIGGLVLVLILSFRPQLSPTLAPLRYMLRWKDSSSEQFHLSMLRNLQELYSRRFH